MRDIIWTIIVIWIVWRLYEAFSSLSKARTRPAQQQSYNPNQQQQQYYSNPRKEGEVNINSAANSKKPYFKDDDGEYVDYEEVK